MPGLPAGSVRIHVLGPPREDKDLYRPNPRKGESYDYGLAVAASSASRLLSAVEMGKQTSLRDEANYPFNERYRLKEKSATPAAHQRIGSRLPSQNRCVADN